jgi:hypothetical protein
MYSVKNVIGTTILIIGMFGFSGCGGTCCDSPISPNSGLNPNTNVIEKGNLDPQNSSNDPKPPVAVATVNESDFNITVKPCEVVYFDANNSTDPDGNISNMSYIWTQQDNYELSDEKAFSYKFKNKGTYEITLTITDEQNLTDTDSLLVIVKNSCNY